MQHSPHAMRLNRAVRTAYLRFGRRHVSKDLEVCFCPVCMTPEIRDQIVATRNDALPTDLIKEYSNSAHGVPNNLADLKVLLPRYLELMAEDTPVDFTEVGAELQRFGDAQRLNPGFFTAEERAVLDEWAAAMLEHFAIVDAKNMSMNDPFYLFQVLALGGWSIPFLTSTIERSFSAAITGPTAMRNFAEKVMKHVIRRRDKVGVDWFAMRYCPKEVREQAADWLNLLSGSPEIADLIDENDDRPGTVAINDFVTLSGKFLAELFPTDHKSSGRAHDPH